MFSILRKKAVQEENTFNSNLTEYLALSEKTSNQMRIKTLLDAAVKNLAERENIYEKQNILKQLTNKRLLSTKQLDIMITNSKELEYEQLVIQSEAENLKSNWDIFSEAVKLLPVYKKRQERHEKDNIQKENTFFNKKKETLELSLINRFKTE